MEDREMLNSVMAQYYGDTPAQQTQCADCINATWQIMYKQDTEGDQLYDYDNQRALIIHCGTRGKTMGGAVIACSAYTPQDTPAEAQTDALAGLFANH